MSGLYIQTEPIILASASPRRKALLEEMGIAFECIPADVDEEIKSGEAPQELALRLALSKAETVAKRFPKRFVLGADTDVFIDEMVLGKPRDPADATRLIRLIAGRTHAVWGGAALVNIDAGVSEAIASRTLVTMTPISEDLIARYVATKEPMDKAGGYAVQGIGSQFIGSIEGSYPNVVGLDTPRVLDLLKKYGVIR
jgi:septum formation protein